MAFYNYHPKSTARLGFPIDSRYPWDDKTPNGFFDNAPDAETNPRISADITFSIQQVSTREELYQMMALDLNVEAKFGLSKGSVSLSWEKEINFDEKSLNYVVHGRKLYLPEILSKPVKFSEIGAKAWSDAVQKHKIVNFQRSAGTEVVSQIRRGSSISLIYQFSFTSKELKEKIAVSIAAKWATGNVNMNFESEIRQLDQFFSLKIEGFQSGAGTNSPKLSDIITSSPGDIVAINKNIASILKDISQEDRDNSPIQEFNTYNIADLPDISLSDYSDIFQTSIELNDLINRAAITLSNTLLENVKECDFLQLLLSQYNPTDFMQDAEQKIKNKVAEFQAQAKLIYSQYQTCIKATSEAECNVTIDSIKPLNYSDVLRIPFIVPLAWNCTPEPVRTSEPTAHFNTHMCPLVYIKFPYVINFIYIVCNGSRLQRLAKDDIAKISNNGGSFSGFWEIVTVGAEQTIPDWEAPTIYRLGEAEKSRDIQSQKGKVYQLIVYLDDGSSHTVNLGNPAEPIVVI